MDAATENLILSQIGRLLDEAVIYDNRKREMGLREIKEALRGHPGRQSAHLTGNPRGPTTLTLAGQEIEISPKDTVQAIRSKLEAKPEALLKVDIAVAALDEPVQVTILAEKPNMSILGLEAGAFQAKLAEIRKRVADKQTQGLNKIGGAAEAGMVKIDAAADGTVAKIDREIDAQVEEFAKFGDNGGPA